MGFTELTFLFIGLPVSIVFSIIFYFAHSVSFANLVLLFLSTLFYMAGGGTPFLTITMITVFTIVLGRLVYHKRQWIWIGAVVPIVWLWLYKYATWLAPDYFSSIITPLGISFVTFSSISYVVDIYRKQAKPGTLIEAALYILFFPKILSGPIALWKSFAPQVKERSVSLTDISEGLELVILGLFKKVVIADTFGAVIATINGNMEIQAAGDTLTYWLVALLYFFQIYFDFSGYSDTAIGLSNMFGFALPQNFKTPYASKSITEFWRRWHISLGSWFREYVYIPLGGSRTGNVYINLFVVFLLTGIWHGANWTFVLWGILNGIVIVMERYLSRKKLLENIPAFWKHLFTVCFLFFSWILFMSPSLSSALSFYTHMFTGMSDNFTFSWKYYTTPRLVFLIVLAGIASVISTNKTIYRSFNLIKKSKMGTILVYLGSLVLFIITLLFVINSSYSPNLYFQF